MKQKQQAFTLIELLVVVAIIVILIAILLPSLKDARNQAKSTVCSSSLRQLGALTMMYAFENNNTLPSQNGPIVNNYYFYFTPMRLLLLQNRPPLKIMTCPTDLSTSRLFKAGHDNESTTGQYLGIGDTYAITNRTVANVRVSYGYNYYMAQGPSGGIYMTRLTGWRAPTTTVLYADSTYYTFAMYDSSPYQYNRIALSNDNGLYASSYGGTFVDIPALARHVGKNSIVFLDGHAELVSQRQTFNLTYANNRLGSHLE